MNQSLYLAILETHLNCTKGLLKYGTLTKMSEWPQMHTLTFCYHHFRAARATASILHIFNHLCPHKEKGLNRNNTTHN